MHRSPIASVGLTATLLLVTVAMGAPAAAGTSTADSHAVGSTNTTFAVGQAGQCLTEIQPLVNRSETGVEYYDYRIDGRYASHGTTAVQESGVSQLYVFAGSDGMNLVILHDRLGDGRSGGAVSFTVTGLPVDGEWIVEDDDYENRDDTFVHSGTSSALHWMWAPNRTDGAVFRGLGSEDWTELTIRPSFGNDSYAAEHGWQWASDGPSEWQVRDGRHGTTSLDPTEPISIRQGGCDEQQPSVTLAGSPGEAENTVTLRATTPDSPTTPIEYRWDVDGDGTVEMTTDSATVEHRYNASGAVSVAVTVVDRFGATSADSATVTVGTNGSAPPSTAGATTPTDELIGDRGTGPGEPTPTATPPPTRTPTPAVTDAPGQPGFRATLAILVALAYWIRVQE